MCSTDISEQFTVHPLQEQSDVSDLSNQKIRHQAKKIFRNLVCMFLQDFDR